ncbi:MAG TPA: hypothetical protein VMU18_02960 [Rhodoblastus sp.]|nr:hypothetical protein [Rhodoblastus sp.]
MKFYEFEHVYLPRVLIPLLGGLFVICALHGVARADSSVLALGGDSFIVKSDEGYGVNDCIRSGDDCAKIVADAWCESHGHGEARAYGRAAENLTASIQPSSATTSAVKIAAPRIAPDDVFISCGQ